MDKNTKIRFATLVAFAALFEIAITLAVKFGASPQWTPQILISLAVGASLGGRAIAYLTIFEWLRYPFTEVIPHSSGAGESVEPFKDRGPIVEVIGTWMCCPVCSGTWAALGLALLYVFLPVYGELVIYVIAAGSLGSILTRAVESIEWSAHFKHEATGQLNRINKIETRQLARQEELEKQYEAHGGLKDGNMTPYWASFPPSRGIN